MSFNAVDAAKMLTDKVLTDDEVKYFVSLRGGRPYLEIQDDEEYKTLIAMGLIQHIAFTHPRATLSIDGVIPTEEGMTLMNVIDQRWRENAFTPTEPYSLAPQNVEPETVRLPTETEKQEVATTKEGKEKVLDAQEGRDELSQKRAEARAEALKDPLSQEDDLMEHINPSDPRTKTIEEVKRGDDRTVAKNATVKVEGDKSAPQAKSKN